MPPWLFCPHRVPPLTNSLAGYYYTEKGLSALVWEETLKEPEFADAENIVRSVQL